MLKLEDREWDDIVGCNRWPCGCLEFQDGYEWCQEHSQKGYENLKESIWKQSKEKKRILVTLVCCLCAKNLEKVRNAQLDPVTGKLACFDCIYGQ
jgi:hypothetical protein